MSAGTDRFAQARANEHQLNERQRAVIELLVKGRTNGEIAAELGMTLDGAKWNVSEILGKLGLESREQAAEYWRDRGRRKMRLPAMRGLAGVTALKWAGGVAAVAVVGLVVLAVFGRDEDEPATGLPPFYIEARFHIDDRSRTIGTQAADSEGAAIRREGTVRWWQQDVDHARMELTVTAPAESAGTDIIAVDGDNQFYYRALSNTYTRSPLYDFPAQLDLRVRPWSMSSFLGPWAVDAGSLDAMLEQMAGDGRLAARIVGTERLLGRETTVVELSPVNVSNSESWSADGQHSPNSSTSGISRIWVDEEHLVVLKHVVEDEVQPFTFEVAKLEWHPSGVGKSVRFEPPKGAELVDAHSGAVVDGDFSSSGGSLGPGGSGQLGFQTPSGMLRFPAAPDGLRSVGVEEQQANQRVELLRVRYEGVDDASVSLVLTQRVLTSSSNIDSAQGVPVVVRHTTGKASSTNDTANLSWQHDRFLVTLSGVGFSQDELLAFAESLEVAP